MKHGVWALVCTLPWLMSCLVVREPEGRADTTCTACHGDASRSVELLARSAPPKDLRGNVDERFPGVGAHQRHLLGSPLFPPVKCSTCHPVPEQVTSAGHDDGQVQIWVPSPDGGAATHYNQLTRTCAESACHSAASGVWTRPRSTEEACGSCHGLPPPVPHPQSANCGACHGELSASTHLDGLVTRVAVRCDACHGSGDAGAPPRGLDGGTSPTQRGVGAHQAHLSGGANSKKVGCESCHEVPSAGVTHPNGGAAEVQPAVGFDSTTASCRNACHRDTSPTWTSPGPLPCTGCHGEPPALPHPQLRDCAICHPAVNAGHREQHVNGIVDVMVPQACDGCHGSAANPAPPRDLDGGTTTDRPGVGAHQAHLIGRGFARPVECRECHTVPTQVRSPGHLDGVVQVLFSGTAINGALTPRYQNATCSNTACHDLSGYLGTTAGGSTPAPVWTSVDGGQATCTSCHGQPPPAPHVARADCGSCHRLEVMHHVNGHLDFLP